MAKTTKPEATAAAPRPYLKSVHLRNAPPLRDVKASFQPGLNIIIGPNGAGKTQFMRLVSELTEFYHDKQQGEGCELVFGGLEPEMHIQFEAAVVQRGRHNKPAKYAAGLLPLRIRATAGLETTETTTLSEAASLNKGLLYQTVEVWHGLPSFRLPLIDGGLDLVIRENREPRPLDAADAAVAGSRLAYSFVDMLSPFEAGASAASIAAVPRETISAFIKEAVACQLDRLNDRLPLYSPIRAVRLGDQFQVYNHTTQAEVIITGLTLEYQVAGDWLPFGALSDGTKRIFYLIGEVLAPTYSMYSAPPSGFYAEQLDKIIFLEEPELGIHPKQLHKLLQFIREVSRENQVILTTHSPQTLDMLTAQELDRITICDYVPGKGTQLRKLSAEKKKKARAYLKNEGFLSEFWRFSNLESPD